MAKSLFDDSKMDITIGLKEKKKEEIPELLPKNDETKPMEMSGAFFIKDGHLVTDIRLEFDVENKLYGIYMKKLQDFVKECEKVHVLKSSSGI